MGYGYLHRGRIVEPDAITGGYIVEIPTLAPGGRRMGPFAALVPNLDADDRVVLASLGESRDEMVIIGRVPGESTPIGEIPGLQAALDALTAQDVVLDGRLDVVEPIVTSHTATLATHTSQIAGKVSTTSVGAAGGVASLDGSGRHPAGELNTSVELISRKNAASGYAGLDGSSKLTGSQQVYSASATTVTTANAAGAANTASRGDHAHALPVTVQRTVWLVEREDNATIVVTSAAARSVIHTVALTGLTAETIYKVEVKVPAFCSVTGAKMRISLHKGSSANPTLDDSTPEVQSVGADEVHALRLLYYYKTLAAETAVTFVVSGYRYAGTGTVTFFAFNGMPYTFEVTQMGTTFNTF